MRRIATFVLLAGVAGAAMASNDAWDNAAQYVTWSDPAINGGAGFAPWVFRTYTDGGSAGFFRAVPATSADLNDIATEGKAWAVYANQGTYNEAVAFRGFTGGPLRAPCTFSVSLEHGGIVPGAGSVGFCMRTGNVASAASDYNVGSRFEFVFIGGKANYSIVDAAGEFDTGIGWSSRGLKIAFTLTTENTYDLQVVRIDTQTTNTFRHRYLAGSRGAGIESVALYAHQLEPNTDQLHNDAFFNSLSVSNAPIPGTVLSLR